MAQRHYAFAVLPGDGIGPEVVAQGIKVLDRVAKLEGFTYETTRYPFGAEHYLKTRETLPESVLTLPEECGRHGPSSTILMRFGRTEPCGCEGPGARAAVGVHWS